MLSGKGLITADLDIALSDAISFIEGSAEISENLPLFRSIESDTSNLLIKAGAIPDAGVGKPIGAEGVETLISLMCKCKIQNNAWLLISNQELEMDEMD